LSGAVAKSASINLQKLVLSPTGSIKPWFHTEGNLLLCSSYLPLGVPNWVASTAKLGTCKAMVTTLGLSTWRIPEPKHVAWLNSCGMLKVTHKVCVPFTVGDYVDEVECDVLPLEVCGLLLGCPW
jgi:hypothetical protein